MAIIDVYGVIIEAEKQILVYYTAFLGGGRKFSLRL
jgi:hypothetical protein